MASLLCGHCNTAVSRQRCVTRAGNSYHDACHKCYVCSETNLTNCEVFKGVIFCSSCSQRIFQGCCSARQAKTNLQRSSAGPRSPFRRHVKHHKERRQREEGIIALAAKAAQSTDTESETVDHIRESKMKAPSLELETLHSRVHDLNGPFSIIHISAMNSQFMKTTSEMGTTTTVTQQLLKELKCPVVEWSKVKEARLTEESDVDKHIEEVGEHKRNKRICSDMRMAELGVSTEIANMGLVRKHSGGPVYKKSRSSGEQDPSHFVPDLSDNVTDETLVEDGKDWIEGSLSDVHVHTLRTTVATSDFWRVFAERDVRYFVTKPFRYFKSKILDRSSLISIVASDTHKNTAFLRRLKLLFHEEVSDHHCRGIRRLHSTIIRRRTPYKLGWLHLEREKKRSACRHYQRSPSYRCFRNHVMYRAGPTSSQMQIFWHKLCNLVLPEIVKRFLNLNDDVMLQSEACGLSDMTSIINTPTKQMEITSLDKINSVAGVPSFQPENMQAQQISNCMRTA